jgi:AcrR family transcriptional regulator
MAAPTKRAEMAETRRLAILQAAKEEFVAKGFAAARMEDIAKRAGVAKGTVYLHFPDKEQLFGAVVSAHMAPIAARIGGGLAAGGPRLRPLIEPLLMGVLREISGPHTGPVLRLLVSEAIRFPQLSDRYRQEFVEPMMAVQRVLLTRAAENGELRNPDFARFPQLMVAPLVMGVIWQALFGQAIPLDMEAALKTHLDTVFVT